MGHAIFAVGISSYTIDNAVTIPINILEHFGIRTVMTFAIGQEVAGRLPAQDISSGDSPSGAGQIAVTGEKLPIDRCPEQAETLPPGLGFRNLFDRVSAREEESGWVDAEALRHVCLGSVVIVSRSNGVTIHVESAEVIQ